MATRRTYSDEDKARAYVAWVTNDKVMRRTARTTGIPQTTLRQWITEWEEQGPPIEQAEKIAEIATDFVQEATRVRDKALAELEKKIPTAKPSELVTPSECSPTRSTWPEVWPLPAPNTFRHYRRLKTSPGLSALPCSRHLRPRKCATRTSLMPKSPRFRRQNRSAGPWEHWPIPRRESL